jgi:MFS transporter, DHA1 family, multidrug resistance protein
MLLMSQGTNMTSKATPVFSALALAFASLGDAFLYPFLPVNSLLVGIPIAWVGVVLSINRFVRIVANTWLVNVFSRYGLRTVTAVAVCLALLSTTGYAFADSISFWLFCRVVWGLSFSAMRTGTLGYALGQAKNGIAIGISRGLQEIGPVAALLLAPLLITTLRPTSMFLVLALLSLPALYFVSRLPVGNDKPDRTPSERFARLPSIQNSITFCSSFLIDGVVIVELGQLFLSSGWDMTSLEATTLTAFCLGYRRICLMVTSPVGGWLADRIGFQRVFRWSLIFAIVGIMIVLLGWVDVGIVVTFTFYSIHVATAPGAASQAKNHALYAVSVNATGRDLGAATGTLSGGFLLQSTQLPAILIIATFMTMILLSVDYLQMRTAKIYTQWK